MIRRIQEELLGRHFSSKTELRHIAEGAGFNFVPVDILRAGDNEALAVLRPKGLGEIRVQAVRPAAWQAFRIVDVQPAGRVSGA